VYGVLTLIVLFASFFLNNVFAHLLVTFVAVAGWVWFDQRRIAIERANESAVDRSSAQLAHET
jgi:hypothetical protein